MTFLALVFKSSVCVCVFNLSNFTCDTDGKASCEIFTYQREGVLLCVHILWVNIYRINDRLISVIESLTYMLLFVNFRRSSSFLARNFSYQMFSVLKLLLALCYTGLVQELYCLIMCIVGSWQWPLVQSSAATWHHLATWEVCGHVGWGSRDLHLN